MIRKINSNMNESVNEDESDTIPTTVDQIMTQGDLSDYAKEVDLDAAKEPIIDYTDPKYQKVLDYLNAHGYPSSKFLGRGGYSIPQNPSYAYLVLDDIFSDCCIVIDKCRLNPASATELMGELTKLIPIVDDINAILSDATDASTKDRHVNESTLTDSKIIELGNQNFGKPGTYILYRNGEHQTKRGFISFAADKAVADRYSKNGRQTEKFAVTIKNPYVVENVNTSFQAFADAYHNLVGSYPTTDDEGTKINDAWRKCDAQIAKKLVENGYDSLIYMVPQNVEVNVVGEDIDKMPNINEYNESVPQALGLE